MKNLNAFSLRWAAAAAIAACSAAILGTTALATAAPDAPAPSAVAKPRFALPPVAEASIDAAAVTPLAVPLDAAPPQALLESAMARVEQEAARAGTSASSSSACRGRHHHGVRYSVQRLEVPGGNASYPTAINNNGLVVGSSSVSSGVVPTLWINGSAINLGTLGGTIGYAYDITDAGKIVGFSTDANGATRAFTWYRGQLSPLANLGGATNTDSVARGINRFNVIAGESEVPVGNAVRAVVWTHGTPRALETLGGSFTAAYRINDAGYSVGIANLSDASLHGAL